MSASREERRVGKAAWALVRVRVHLHQSEFMGQDLSHDKAALNLSRISE